MHLIVERLLQLTRRLANGSFARNLQGDSALHACKFARAARVHLLSALKFSASPNNETAIRGKCRAWSSQTATEQLSEVYTLDCAEITLKRLECCYQTSDALIDALKLSAGSMLAVSLCNSASVAVIIIIIFLVAAKRQDASLHARRKSVLQTKLLALSPQAPSQH